MDSFEPSNLTYPFYVRKDQLKISRNNRSRTQQIKSIVIESWTWTHKVQVLDLPQINLFDYMN